MNVDSPSVDAQARLDLVKLLNQINAEDVTTSDAFWLHHMSQPNLSAMSHLVHHVLSEKLRMLPRATRNGTVARSYQFELFARAALGRTNYIVYLPTGSGKTLISYLYIEYMIRQYPQKQVVFLANSVALISQQFTRFLSESGLSRDLVLCAYGGKVPRNVLLDNYKVIFATPVVYQQLLEARQCQLHHCSLLIFDEAHHARKEHPYARILRENVMGELPEHRPRLLGLTASPTEGRNLDESLASLDLICSLFDGTITTPLEPASIDDLRAATAMTETIIDEYIQTIADTDAEKSIVEYISACVELLVSQEFQDISDNVVTGGNMNHFPTDFYDPDSYMRHSDYVLGGMNVRHTRNYRAEAVDELHMLWSNFKSGEQVIALSNPSASRLILLVSVIENNTRDGVLKTLARSILVAWEALEEIGDFGADVARETLDFLTPLVDSHLTGVDGRYRRLVLSWNTAKHILKEKLQTLVAQHPGGGGKLATLLKRLVKMDPKSRAVVFVQTRASAMKLSKVLISRRISCGHVVGKTDMTSSAQLNVVKRFNEGQFNVLVATSVVEEGLDVQSCDLVIRLDGTTTSKSLIQSRGRARNLNSRYVLIVTARDRPQLELVMKKEHFMMAAVRHRCDPEGLAREGIDLEALWAEYQAMAEGMSTSPLSHRLILEECQKNGEAYPVFTYEEDERSTMRFMARVTFSNGDVFEGYGTQKKEAKFRACDKALAHYQQQYAGPEEKVRGSGGSNGRVAVKSESAMDVAATSSSGGVSSFASSPSSSYSSSSSSFFDSSSSSVPARLGALGAAASSSSSSSFSASSQLTFVPKPYIKPDPGAIGTAGRYAQPPQQQPLPYQPQFHSQSSQASSSASFSSHDQRLPPHQSFMTARASPSSSQPTSPSNSFGESQQGGDPTSLSISSSSHQYHHHHQLPPGTMFAGAPATPTLSGASYAAVARGQGGPDNTMADQQSIPSLMSFSSYTSASPSSFNSNASQFGGGSGYPQQSGGYSQMDVSGGNYAQRFSHLHHPPQQPQSRQLPQQYTFDPSSVLSAMTAPSSSTTAWNQTYAPAQVKADPSSSPFSSGSIFKSKVRQYIHPSLMNGDNPIGALQEACQKAASSSSPPLPEYHFVGVDPHSSHFIMECRVPDIDHPIGVGKASQKQLAKKYAAVDFIAQLLQLKK